MKPISRWWHSSKKYAKLADALYSDPDPSPGIHIYQVVDDRVQAENAAALAWRVYHPWRYRLSSVWDLARGTK